MKFSVSAFGGLSSLMALTLVVGLVLVKPVMAQVEATSSEAVASSTDEVRRSLLMTRC
jgi:hypothetical protein